MNIIIRRRLFLQCSPEAFLQSLEKAKIEVSRKQASAPRPPVIDVDAVRFQREYFPMVMPLSESLFPSL